MILNALQKKRATVLLLFLLLFGILATNIGPIFLYDYGVILSTFGLRLKFLNFCLHNKNSKIEISVYI